MKYLTRKQIKKIDDLAVRNGLEVRQMMELAGWHMLNVFSELRIQKNKKILVAAGIGNNGGDALCAARHLYNNGYKNLHVLLAKASLRSDAFHQLRIVRKMKIPTKLWNKRIILKDYGVIIDGLIGYQLRGNPKKPYDAIIKAINESKAKVISYDIASGLEATSGKAFDPCVFADATLTLHAPKKGLNTREGKKISGRVFIGDLGIPESFYKKSI